MRIFAWAVASAFILCGYSLLVAGSPEEMELARKIAMAQIPLGKIAEPWRSKVAAVLHRPALFDRGPIEAFPCRPAVYEWLLDHPDWAYQAWEEMGAKSAAISRQTDGSFKATDRLGSELAWRTVINEPGRRVWYAEGSGRALPIMPLVTLRAVLLLNYDEVQGKDRKVGIRHQAELFVQYDSNIVTKLAKLFGLSPEEASKRTLQQLELFFSGMAWYLCEQPARAKVTLVKSQAKPEYQEIQTLLKTSGVVMKDHY